MAIVYDWVVEQMSAYPQYEGEQDVVFTVYWRLNGTDGGYAATVYGSVGVSYNPQTPFTPYENLTQEQVIGWVKEALNTGKVKVADYEASIAKQIEDQKNPPVVTPPLPWA